MAVQETISDHSRGGPYTFRDPLVHGRADLTADPDVTLDVASNFWPILVDWGDEGEPESFARAAPVIHTYETDDDFTIVISDPRGATDTFDVTIAGNA